MSIEIDTIQCWARWQPHLPLARKLLPWVDYESYEVWGSPCVRILIEWNHRKQMKLVLTNPNAHNLPVMVLDYLDSICEQNQIRLSGWHNSSREIRNPYQEIACA